MRRPDVFTIDYSHTLAQGLAFAMLGCQRGASVFLADSLDRGVCSAVGGAKWATDIGRYVISLDGSDDHVVLPEIDSTGVKTLSFLCYPENVSSTRHPIQICSSVDDRISVGYVWSGTVLVSQRASNKYTKEFNIGASRAWKGISIRKDASNINDTYLDGVDVTSPGTNYWNDPSLVSYIGRRTSGSYFYGLIGDVFVHNRYLSPAEIALIADRTDPMLGGLIVEERPVLYFDMGGSTVDALTASNLTISAPVLGAPTLAQIHALTASGLTVSAPVLGTPAIDQTHALTATGLVVSSPVLGTPAIGQAHALTAQNFTASSPVLGAPAVGQVHALTANNLTVSSPVLGTPELNENAADVDALTAVDLVVGSPVLGTPSLGQIHVLGSDGLVTGAPVLGSPSITQIHALEALGLTVGVPVLGTPALNGSDIVLIDASEVGRATTLQARNYRSTLAKRNYTARL